MRIVHFSDLHAKFEKMPAADLYVCTGDMLPNFWMSEYRMKDGTIRQWCPHDWAIGRGRNEPLPNGVFLDRHVIPSKESEYQRIWIDQLNARGGFRKLYLENSNAPVVCIRGNHDFTDLIHLFGGEVYELGKDASAIIDVKGIRFGGMRGINFIRGEWSDELRGGEFSELAQFLPRTQLDILITHAPPLGILDVLGPGYSDPNQHVGVSAIVNFITEQCMTNHNFFMHLFGHVHGSKGIRKENNLTFSNAATGYNVLEI